MNHLSSIQLNNFRNLAKQEIELCNSTNVFIGANGSGKTNLLESISLLEPGRGFKKKSLETLSEFKNNNPWIVYTKYNQNNNVTGISITFDKTSNGLIKKRILIDGNTTKETLEKNYGLKVVWFLPEMERLFIGSPSIRRNFVDRISYSFDSSVLKNISLYKKLIRERSLILKQNNFDNAWIDTIEDKIANLGYQIIISRKKTITILNQIFNEILNKKQNINICKLSIYGTIEEKINEIIDDNKSIAIFKDELIKYREEDRIKGLCSIGPHRSDLEVIYLKNQVDASLCSTGQQKEIILSILLCQCYCLVKKFNISPIVLLDEVCSHLDDNTRSILLSLTGWLNIQVLMTGTDKNLFSFLSTKSKFFVINNGKVKNE
ncbi:MAG: DNA replication and repair protein RecF [Alphaproteobacteria bacterium MarineAlpha5_Bin11]|nr:hypothetical protein [Pelagibacteraceae bacterium]PPR45168.1 MAG: DNA replication and repair protein RecF [Alphaproteobacteria bacterium MarineAlpha5_Bin11]PPR52140.1 MAG: DNA replication and repair protein RecF [Alphaproteobacteria bacterium MarineAlpha5_Bin10]